MRDGKVVRIIDLDTGESFPGNTYLSGRQNGEFLTFHSILRRLRSAPSATFHDALGYPAEVVERNEGFGTLNHIRISNYRVIEPRSEQEREQALLALKPLAVHCVSTDKEPERPTAIIGKDRIPTGFDANNTGSCSFSRPVHAMRVRLRYGISDRSDHQTALIQFDEPVLEISLPLPDQVPVPIVDTDLPEGHYLREVRVVGYSGGSVEIHGFKHVYLVSDPSRTSDESRPIPVDKPTISVEQPTSVPPVAVARPAAPVTKHTWEVDSYPRPTDHDPPEWDIGDYNDEPMAMQFANSGLLSPFAISRSVATRLRSTYPLPAASTTICSASR